MKLYLIAGVLVRATSWTEAHIKFAQYVQGLGELQ